MAKRRYNSPFLMGLDPGGDDIIDFGGSQGTSGEDNMFSFEDEELAALIGGFDYVDLADMDTDFDGEITWDEYETWLGQ